MNEKANYPGYWNKVFCNDWLETEGKIWLCLGNMNAICMIDKGKGLAEILGHFPELPMNAREMSISVIENGDKIVFSPFRADSIAVYNLTAKKLDFVEIKKFAYQSMGLQKDEEKFYRMFAYKEYVFLFGIRYPAILRMNLNTYELDYYDEWKRAIESQRCGHNVYFTDGCACDGNELYLPLGNCNGLLQINLENMAWRYLKLDYLKHGILGMTQKDHHVWITEHDVESKYFYRWDINTGKMERINMPIKDAFYAPLLYKNTLLFFANSNGKSCQFDFGNQEWTDISETVGHKKVFGYKASGDEILYTVEQEKGIYRWDLSENRVLRDDYRINNQTFLANAWKEYCKDFYSKANKEIVPEREIGLNDYLKIISTIS